MTTSAEHDRYLVSRHVHTCRCPTLSRAVDAVRAEWEGDAEAMFRLAESSRRISDAPTSDDLTHARAIHLVDWSIRRAVPRLVRKSTEPTPDPGWTRVVTRTSVDLESWLRSVQDADPIVDDHTATQAVSLLYRLGALVSGPMQDSVRLAWESARFAELGLYSHCEHQLVTAAVHAVTAVAVARRRCLGVAHKASRRGPGHGTAVSIDRSAVAQKWLEIAHDATTETTRAIDTISSGSPHTWRSSPGE